MTELLAAALAFPTVVYTILLVVVVVYWLFVVLGALDIDILDVGDADGVLEGGADGAAEGAAEALDGAIDGAADGAAEAIDGAVDGAADGAAEGAGETDLEAAGGGLGALLSALRLRSAPLTVVISSIVLIAWTLSMLAMYYLGGLVPGVALVPLVGLAAFLVAVPATSLVIRPLAPVFAAKTGRTRADVVGNIAIVTTGRVDERFGQADCKVGGDYLRIEVRARADRGIARGQEVLVIDFDTEREAYVVEPLAD